MIKVIRYTLILYMALILIGCQSRKIKAPLFEDCILTGSSVYCVDKRLNDNGINYLIQLVRSNENLDEDQKSDLIAYFDYNREDLIKNKSYELSLSYLMFFRGYTIISPIDRNNLQQFMDSHLSELEKYRIKYGCLDGSTNTCKTPLKEF